MKKIGVLIVDDHVVLAEGVQSMLEGTENIEVLGLAHNGAEALDRFQELKPDVVLLDINLPDTDGLEVCAEMKATKLPTSILALTMHQEEAFITGMIDNGASGFLLKNVAEAELKEAIEAVHGGDTYYSKEVTQTLLQTLISNQRRSNGSEKKNVIEISEREKDVLRLIVEEFTTSEIAERLHISQNTVETHRRHLLEKLGARNVAGLVRIAMENKLL